jgi:hypothetical protein
MKAIKHLLILLVITILAGCSSVIEPNAGFLDCDDNCQVPSASNGFFGKFVLRWDAKNDSLIANNIAQKYCAGWNGVRTQPSAYTRYSNFVKYSFQCNGYTSKMANSPPSTYSAVNNTSSKDSRTQCREFGFSENSTDFSNCVLQLELTKRKSAESEERYRAEQAKYERQLAAIEREKERRRGAALFELGTRMIGGQRPIDALGSLGTGAPIAPARPTPINQTITLPNGRMINCATMGTMTNCF